MKKLEKIAIVGGTIWGNRGAEAMLATVIGRIRLHHPTAEFFVFSYYPEKDRELISRPDISILSGTPAALVFNHFLAALLIKGLGLFHIVPPAKGFFRSAIALKNVDLLLDIGGITFSDGREKFLPFNILTIWPAMILGVPVVKLAQAVGPFDHRINRTVARHFLSRCQHIFVRGDQSASFIANLSLPKDIAEPAADIAFIYESVFTLSSENETRIQTLLDRISEEKRNGKKIIVFSPSILVDRKLRKKGTDYPSIFLSAIEHLKTDDYFFIFMPNSTRDGSKKKHNNDLLLITEIKEVFLSEDFSREKDGSVEWIDFDINTASIRAIVSSCDLLVTSRYHAMISGLALSIPTIVIGWGHKYNETMQAFDLSEYVMGISQDHFDLLPTIREALTGSEEIKKRLDKNLPEIIALAENQFQYIDRMFQ